MLHQDQWGRGEMEEAEVWSGYLLGMSSGRDQTWPHTGPIPSKVTENCRLPRPTSATSWGPLHSSHLVYLPRVPLQVLTGTHFWGRAISVTHLVTWSTDTRLPSMCQMLLQNQANQLDSGPDPTELIDHQGDRHLSHNCIHNMKVHRSKC